MITPLDRTFSMRCERGRWNRNKSDFIQDEIGIVRILSKICVVSKIRRIRCSRVRFVYTCQKVDADAAFYKFLIANTLIYLS